MIHHDLVIRHGTVVTDRWVAAADIAIADGRIAAIGPELDGDSREEIDAGGLHLLPGVIDAHVHFNEPGRTEWEGWATGSRAVAAGGGTTCFDMPLNAHPPTLDAASFGLKLAAAEAAALTDFALWGGLVPGTLDRLPELAECGVIGLKAFMSQSGTDDFAAADDLTLYEGMREAARLGLIVAVHAESDAITSRLAARAIAAGQTTARDYLASRPVIAELEAISRAILLAEEAGCALHVVHVSTGRGFELIAAAKARGVDVSCETCPHYLFFTEDDIERLGAIAKCAPPLRSGPEQTALWDKLRSGELPMVASDHSPAPATMKGGDDFFQVWGGISGCQSTLPALLTAGYHQRGLSLPLIASLSAGYVAHRFRLPAKGRLEPGADADIALVDLEHVWTLSAGDLHDRHKLSPFTGQAFRGVVRRTLLRGHTIFRDGQFSANPAGRLVRPEPRAEPPPGQASTTASVAPYADTEPRETR
ncbi:MAG: allantoinase [Chloroflexota bacterium]|nr:allantoinase [Chloroflexota bacterium]